MTGRIKVTAYVESDPTSKFDDVKRSCVTVRSGEWLTCTPWLIGTAAVDAAKAIATRLHNEHPEADIERIGFD